MRKIRWNDAIYKRTQALVLWTLGTLGIINELFVQKTPRPEAWPIIGGLLALPFADRFDRARSQSPDPSPSPSISPSSTSLKPSPSQADPGARG